MKLSVTNPEIFELLRDFPSGLWPTRLSDRFILIVKAPREMALAAKLRRAFHIYLVPLSAVDVPTHGLLTAFFDDHDEPLIIRTPLFQEDFTHDFLSLLSSPVFYVHFFDDHDRELAAFRVDNPKAIRFQLLSNTFRFVPPTLDLARQFHDDMQIWFGHRSPADDDAAFIVHLRESLFPDQLADHIDNPGAFNEPDIAAALHRAFRVDQVFTNPVRTDNGRELTDVLVATSRTLLLIQTKDSPSTESSISRILSRKRATAVKHVKKAARQLTGSINQLRTRESIDLIIGGKRRNISISGLHLFGLTVVKELFEPDRPSCSRPILDVFASTGIPCVLLDYVEFRQLTFFQPTEDELVATLSSIFNVANQLDTFPPSRFGLRTDQTVVYRPRPSAHALISSTDQTR